MKWCKVAECWCDEAEDITEGQLGCDYDCNNCDECVLVTNEEKEDIEQ